MCLPRASKPSINFFQCERSKPNVGRAHPRSRVAPRATPARPRARDRVTAGSDSNLVHTRGVPTPLVAKTRGCSVRGRRRKRDLLGVHSLRVIFLLLLALVDYITLQIPPHVTNARRSALDDRVFALRNARMRVGRRVSRARAGTRVGPVGRKKATPSTVRGRRPSPHSSE